ncbi:hypothetical protein SprV_0200876300 [Sparganum proliferum]
MFSNLLMDPYRDERTGIRIVYRADRHLLSCQRVQASTCLSVTAVRDLLFVDDCASNAETEADTQRSKNLFAVGCANFGLTSNTGKTVVMHQPPANAAYSVLRIYINSAGLETVDKFTYLGSTISSCVKINDEVIH